MQDRYAFDLGDYSKLGLLRALEEVGRPGILWYLNHHQAAKERTNGDGRHLQHLNGPSVSNFAACDPHLHSQMVRWWPRDQPHLRSVALLQRASGLNDPHYYESPIPPRGKLPDRESWFSAALQHLKGCELVCCDPDNGVATAGSVNERRASPKHKLLTEAVRLVQQGHSLVLYHHFSRQRTHAAQASDLKAVLSERLGLPVVILRWNTISPRAYVVVKQIRHDKALTAGISRLLASPWGRSGHFSAMT